MKFQLCEKAVELNKALCGFDLKKEDRSNTQEALMRKQAEGLAWLGSGRWAWLAEREA